MRDGDGQVRAWQGFSVKERIVNILSFAGPQEVSVMDSFPFLSFFATPPSSNPYKC